MASWIESALSYELPNIETDRPKLVDDLQSLDNCLPSEHIQREATIILTNMVLTNMSSMFNKR